MPKFIVTLPDGREEIVEAPEGTDPAALAAEIAKKVRPQATGATAGIMDRIGTGIVDNVYGLGQLGARGMEAVLPERLGGRWAAQNRKDFEGLMGERESAYQKSRGDQGGTFDPARVIGSVLATIPLGGVGAGAKGLQLAKQGAVLGGVGAAAQPVTDSENFWTTKGAQTGLGAATGAVAAPVADAAIKGATGLTQRFVEARRAAAGAASGVPVQQAAEQMLRQSLGDARLARTAAETRQQLIDDVTGALQTTGRLDPAAVRRLADFREAGIQPTKAWVTADPTDFTKQHNMAGIEGYSKPLIDAEAAAHKRMGGMLDEIRPQQAGATQYEQGAAMAGKVKNVQEVDDARITSLYEQFKNAAQTPQLNRVGDKTFAYETPVGDAAWVLKTAQQRLGDAVLDLPETWAKKLASYGEGKPLTPSEIQILYKAANAQSSKFPAEMQTVKKVLLEEMERISAGATDAQRAATKAAKANFERQDASPPFADAVKGSLKDEKFFDKYIVSAPYKQVERLWTEMGQHPTFVSEARAAAVDRLKGAAFGTQETGKGSFAFDRFKREIGQPGMKEKLKLMLDPQDYKKVELLERLSTHLQAPAGNKANRSNTGGATIGFALRILNSLGNTGMITSAIRGAASVPGTAQVARAANAQVDDIALRAVLPQLPPELREMAVRAFGAASAGGASSYMTPRSGQ